MYVVCFDHIFQKCMFWCVAVHASTPQNSVHFRRFIRIAPQRLLIFAAMLNLSFVNLINYKLHRKLPSDVCVRYAYLERDRIQWSPSRAVRAVCPRDGPCCPDHRYAAADEN